MNYTINHYLEVIYFQTFMKILHYRRAPFSIAGFYYLFFFFFFSHAKMKIKMSRVRPNLRVSQVQECESSSFELISFFFFEIFLCQNSSFFSIFSQFLTFYLDFMLFFLFFPLFFLFCLWPLPPHLQVLPIKIIFFKSKLFSAE